MSVEVRPEDVFEVPLASPRSPAHAYVAYSDMLLFEASQKKIKDYQDHRWDYRDTDFARLLPKPGELLDLDRLPLTLGGLAVASDQVGLSHLRAGFYGYMKVSEKVRHNLSTGFFQYPEKMERAMPEFANTIFRACWYHVLGMPEAVNTWHRPFYSDRSRLWTPGEGMLVFMPGHIEMPTDLPEALLLTETEPKHEYDYTVGINKILRDVAEENFDNYAVMRTPLESVTKKMAIWTVSRELRIGRSDAWRQFEILNTAESKEEFHDIRCSLIEQKRRRGLGESWLGRTAIRTFTDPAPGWFEADGTPTIPESLAA